MKRPLQIGLTVAIILILGVLLVNRESAQAPSESNIPDETESPNSSVPSISATPTAQNIVITSPKVNSAVANPITLTGKARVFEGVFQYALRDASGKIWFQSMGQAGAPDNDGWRNFSVKIPIPVETPRDLIIEVFEYSAKDGSITNLVRVPVKLSTQQTTTLKVFFGKTGVTENDCTTMSALKRTVIQTNEPAYISLTELLKGPTNSEKQAGYYTSLPDNVQLSSLILRSGTATADFTESLQAGVGGSCRVTAIRAQISQTLKQFSTIKSVIISIYGRTEDILQP